jgi:uncharacterized protein (TIGR02246 family)
MNAADEIRARYHEYLEARRKGDVEAVASFCTEDGIVIPPEQQPVVGRADIRKYIEGSASAEIEIELKHVEVEGKLGWVSGLILWNADGERRATAFVDVWRRENGEWRIAACVWNSADGFAIE